MSPDNDLLAESEGTVWSCKKGQDAHDLVVIDVNKIMASVAMIPYKLSPHPTVDAESNTYFVMEKIGADVGDLGKEDVPDGDN